MLIPLFIGFLVMAIAFIAISYIQFKNYTAYRDTLTGLQNRAAYYEYNQVLDGRIKEGTADFALLMVDVNFLKRMNDTPRA